MADTPHLPQPAADPQIGADEWVRRAGAPAGEAGPLGELKRQLRRVPDVARFAFLVALAALVPVVATDDYQVRVGTVTLVFALLALGLNVSVGFAGLLDLGYVAYYGVGAYGYAFLSSSKFGHHWEAWESIPLVVAVAILLGFVLALPSRRLIGDYLAIVTLFFGQIFFVVVSQGYRVSLLGLNQDLGLKPSWDLTGGPNGIANVDRIRAFGATATSERAYFYVALGAVVLVFTALHLADRSRTGRAWRALNDDALAAEVMSMPINWLKLLAVGVGAGVGALAGTINAAILQGAFPSDYNTMVLITIYAIAILGGAGSLTGAVLGAVVVNIALEALKPNTDFSSWTANGRGIFYLAIILALLAKLRPWRRLAAVAAGTIAFGVGLHAIIGAAWPRGVRGLLLNENGDYGRGGWLGWGLRHWLALPAHTYAQGQVTTFNYLLVLLIGLVLCLTLLRGWKRDLLLVPTLWLTAFVFETRLVEEGSGPTRFLLLGVILIVVMAARPQGLLGKPRVEIV